MTERCGTVLIIDDEPVIVDVLKATLQRDHTLLSASNGLDGLALARGERPDLILLDITMPGVDGYQLCATLKTELETQHIPIIFITALGSVEDETRGLKAGAVDYITKPINPTIVQARVGNHVELKKQRDLLEALSTIDGLTGITNRRGFDEFFDREWRRAGRAGTTVSVILMDIDSFKSYNDAYGHVAGDDCLRSVARQLKDVPRRGGDLVARYGGEEFVAVLPDTPFQSVEFMAEKFRASVEQAKIAHAHSDTAPVVTVSVGAATATPDHSCSPSALLAAADKMLYRAKEAGRNRVCVESLEVAGDQPRVSTVVEHGTPDSATPVTVSH